MTVLSEATRELWDGTIEVTLTHDKTAKTRKGWVSLSQITGRLFKLADGRWIRVRAYEDIDFWEASHGSAVEPSEEDGGRADADLSPEAVEARRLAKARHAEALVYVRTYTGSWGLILDIRADRRWGTAKMKLSERQVEVILTARDRDAERSAESLEIARINTELANDDEYLSWKENTDARPSTGEAPELAAQRSPASPVGGPVTEGVYRLPDGRIAKVQRAIHGSQQLYAKLLDTDTGDWSYERGLIRQLHPDHRLTVEEAATFGRLYGRCIVCGRTLTDEKSIADGIGPVCAGRV